MSASKSAAYEASLGACLGLAAQILQPGMAKQDVCQKDVLGPMILTAHRFGQQHFKHIASIDNGHNPRKVLHDLQRDTSLHGNSHVVAGSAVNLALITFGDISWDSEGDVAQTLEMELLDIADRVEEAEKNACVLLSVSPQKAAGREGETAVVWIPRVRNAHSKVAGRFLFYVYPGRAKVVKSVPELVKKLHEELLVINECDSTYNVWTLMMNDSHSEAARIELSPHKQQQPSSPLQNGGKPSINSAKKGKIVVVSREPDIGKSMFTFQREPQDLRHMTSSFDTLLSGPDVSTRSQNATGINHIIQDSHHSDSSRKSPVDHGKCSTKNPACKSKQQPSHSGVVSLSYADPRTLNANEGPKGTGSSSSGICKSADRPFETRYPLPKPAPESLEPELNEDVHEVGHEKIISADVSSNRLLWQDQEHHESAKAMSIHESIPRPAAESSIFNFYARPSNQELDIVDHMDSVSRTAIAKSYDKKESDLSIASNDHEPATFDDSQRSGYRDKEQSSSQAQISPGPCPILEPKPLRSACANYKAKLGARVWWELEYQADKLLSQSSTKQNGSRSGHFAHQKPLSMASSPFMNVKRQIPPCYEPSRRQSAVQSAVLTTIEATENCCDQVLNDSNQDNVLVTEACEPPLPSLIDVCYRSIGSSSRDDPVRKSDFKHLDYDYYRANLSAGRVSFESPPKKAESIVSHSRTDSRWIQSSSLRTPLPSRSQSGSQSSRSSSKRSSHKWYETHDDDEEDEQNAVCSTDDVVNHDMKVRSTSVLMKHKWNETYDRSRRSSIADSKDVKLDASLTKAEPYTKDLWNDYSDPEALILSTNAHGNARSPFTATNKQLSSAEDPEEEDISQWQMTSSNAPYMTEQKPDPMCSKPSFIEQGNVPIRRHSPLQDSSQRQYHEVSAFANDDEPSATYCSPLKPIKEPTPAPIVLMVEMDDLGSTVDARQARQKRLAELRQKKLQQLQKAREEAIASRQKQRPTPALATNDSDRVSLASLSNSNKNHHHPTHAKRPSNRQLIQNALEFTLLAGGSMEKERAAALAALAQSPCDNFLVLLKGAKDMKFRALYQVDRQQQNEVQRIFSVSTSAPLTLTSQAIGQFFKYNSGKKAFLPVETRSFTVKTDACAMQERLVLKRQQHLARLL